MSFDTAELNERLGPMEETWAQTKAPAGAGELPPDGTYQARVERFDFFESNAGELYLKVELSIVGGEHAGWPADVIQVLETDDEQRRGFTKKLLQTLAVEKPDSLIDLPPRLEQVIGAVVEIVVKTSKQADKNGQPYRNVYVNKRLGAGETKPSPSPDDDIPF